ncbi:MAG: 2-oxo-4-hydroxy-4-carboxy-5-ureidoimidazoline decarboxylase [Burkholderiaceae bacterium]
MSESLSLAQLNAVDVDEFVLLLAGIYEKADWVARAAAQHRPFMTLASLKRGLVEAVRDAPADQQRVLLEQHPDLGVATQSLAERAQSAREQKAAGLADIDDQMRSRLATLNQDYRSRFGMPFILAAGGPRGLGLSPAEIEATLVRRLTRNRNLEFAENLRQLHRIAELRLNQRLGFSPALGNDVWDWAQALAEYSEPEFAVRGQLTATYLTQAHQACMSQIEAWMRDACGFDEVRVDAVGNVVGVYHGADPESPRLMTGSHYDTVRNGGRYDGRLGILVPMICVRELSALGRRLALGVEVIAFSEEEGQRFAATFLGSRALLGQFDANWLERRDADGVKMVEAIRSAGFDPADIPAIARDPARYKGFVEIHIEQGPVLDALDLPLGVVTSINGAVRMAGTAIGMASHAGTTPMNQRQDAALAVAELALYVEARASSVPDTVGTVGVLEVTPGSVNVVPGHCRFSLDIRSTTDEVRDECVQDVLAQAERISEQRGVSFTIEETMRAAAAPCDPAWQQQWADAVAALGLPVHRLPSGAGHDAMKMHEAMPQAMLFVRGGNDGISHNPLEIVTSDDAEHCIGAFMNLLENN